MIHRSVTLLACLAAACCVDTLPAQNQRDAAVRQDKQELQSNDDWIYNDFQRARLAAQRAEKPMLIVFR